MVSKHSARIGLVCLILSVLVGGWPSASARAAQSAAAVEYQVKAVFLFNFASFVDWPSAAPVEPGTPFVIGVLGDDPFGATLDEVVANERVAGRPLVVKRFAPDDEVEGCQILFVSDSERRRVGEILERLRGRPVLTVGDMPDFAESGGMIGFSTERGRVRLAINTDAVGTAQLSVRAQLLQLARIVGSTSSGGSG